MRVDKGQVVTKKMMPLVVVMLASVFAYLVKCQYVFFLGIA